MKVKLTLPNAKVPHRAHSTDAGADLFATEHMDIKPQQSKFMDLGVQIELPENTVGLIFAKSGLGSQGIIPRNCVGVIDEQYRGNLGIMIKNDSNRMTATIKTGTKIAQLVVVPVMYPTFEVVDQLSDTERGEGGFGSTGVE